MSDLRAKFLKDVKKDANKAADVFIRKTKDELRKEFEENMKRKLRRERFTTKAKQEARGSEGNIQRLRKSKAPPKFTQGRPKKTDNPEKTKPQLYKRAQVVKRRLGRNDNISGMDKTQLLRYILKHDEPEMKSKFAGTHTRF